MQFFSLISQKQVTPATGQKIIPAKEFSSLKKAADILKIVKEEALEYKKETAKECEIEKENAFKEGFQEGLISLNEKIISLDKTLHNIEEDFKNKILPIALAAAKKIIGTELKISPEVIVDIVIQALKPVIQSHTIKIYVNKDDLNILEDHRNKIKDLLSQVKIFAIEERSDVNPGGCLIETETGIINAQLESQFRALESAFEKFMKK